MLESFAITFREILLCFCYLSINLNIYLLVYDNLIRESWGRPEKIYRWIIDSRDWNAIGVFRIIDLASVNLTSYRMIAQV